MDKKRQEYKQQMVDMSVDIDRQDQRLGEYNLKVTLANRSANPLTIYQHALPWVGWYSMLLIAVKTDVAGSVIEKTLPIDDPGPARTTIEPDEALEGEISLVLRFPTFLEDLKDRDILVFWSYQFKAIDDVPLPRVGGYVLIPKLP